MVNANDKTLLEVEGLRVGERTLTSASGEFQLADVLTVEITVIKSLWVPVLLALIGSVNLAIAMQAGKLDMYVAAGLMMGAGIWIRLRSTRHVLSLTTAEGSKPVWFTRDADACERAHALVAERIAVLRPRR